MKPIKIDLSENLKEIEIVPIPTFSSQCDRWRKLQNCEAFRSKFGGWT